ncbi:hypothetical protein Tco_1517550 [Tanacetum coccineum]
MKQRGCGNSHFIWIKKDGDMKKVHNTDSQGRPGLKFRMLDDILQSADGEYTPSVFAERKIRPRSSYVTEKDQQDCPSNETDVEEMTLSQLMKKCKSKIRKASEPVLLTSKEEVDDIDLSEPLFKFRKVSKCSPSKKIPASKNSTDVNDLVIVKVKVEALQEEYFDCSADPFDCNVSSMFVASEDEVNNKGSGSVTNEGEIAGVSEVSLDNLENTELIDEVTMPNDLLALSVSELDEAEYVDHPLSIVSSPEDEDDPSFEDLNCFQSQLYLQQTPEEVSDVSDSQDSDLAIDDGHFYTDISDEGSPRNQEFGFSEPSRPFLEQSSFVPETVDSEMDFSDHNHQTDVTIEAAEIRNSDCIETRQPERLPSTRKVKSAIKSATKTEETAKKWLSMMSRDCNRFCKIMKLNEGRRNNFWLLLILSVKSTNCEKPVQRERKKISFADEAGGTLCDIKVFHIEQDSSELNEKPTNITIL